MLFCINYVQYSVDPCDSIDVETEALHTTPVLLDHTLTFLLGIASIRKEHAFVSSGFLVFADAAWLLDGIVSKYHTSQGGWLVVWRFCILQ